MIGNRTGNKIICSILVPNQFHPQFHILIYKKNSEEIMVLYKRDFTICF